MKPMPVIALLSCLTMIGISVGLISYGYLNYGTMTIVRLDRALQTRDSNFIDISSIISAIPKMQQGVDEVGIKYDSAIRSCNGNSTGYCNEVPINATFTTVITAGEFQTMDKAVQFRPLKISGNNTWLSSVKYFHKGCLPPAHGLMLDASKSDNYCYYDILVEKR